MSLGCFIRVGKDVFIKFSNKPYTGIELVDCDVPSCKIYSYTRKSKLIGYRIECPKSSIVNPKSLLIGKSNANWKPYLALHGLQIFYNGSAVALLSTKISSYMGKI